MLEGPSAYEFKFNWAVGPSNLEKVVQYKPLASSELKELAKTEEFLSQAVRFHYLKPPIDSPAEESYKYGIGILSALEKMSTNQEVLQQLRQTTFRRGVKAFFTTVLIIALLAVSLLSTAILGETACELIWGIRCSTLILGGLIVKEVAQKIIKAENAAFLPPSAEIIAQKIITSEQAARLSEGTQIIARKIIIPEEAAPLPEKAKSTAQIITLEQAACLPQGTRMIVGKTIKAKEAKKKIPFWRSFPQKGFACFSLLCKGVQQVARMNPMWEALTAVSRWEKEAGTLHKEIEKRLPVYVEFFKQKSQLLVNDLVKRYNSLHDPKRISSLLEKAKKEREPVQIDLYETNYGRAILLLQQKIIPFLQQFDATIEVPEEPLLLGNLFLTQESARNRG